MTSQEQQQQLSQWILDQVATVNPYNRLGQNIKSEYQLYQSGYLAAYLASLMREDPWIQKRFAAHVRQQHGPAAKTAKRG